MKDDTEKVLDSYIKFMKWVDAMKVIEEPMLELTNKIHETGKMAEKYGYKMSIVVPGFNVVFTETSKGE